VDHEGKIGFVESHAQRRGGRDNLERNRLALPLDLQPDFGIRLTEIRGGRNPVGGQPIRHTCSVRDGEAAILAGGSDLRRSDIGERLEVRCLRGAQIAIRICRRVLRGTSNTVKIDIVSHRAIEDLTNRHIGKHVGVSRRRAHGRCVTQRHPVRG
jgi:hypothetical protein